MIGRILRRPLSSRGRLAPSVNDLASSFLLAVQAGGRSVATHSWYADRLRRFAIFMGNPPAGRVSAEDVRRFLVAVKAGAAGVPTRDSYVEGYRKAISALFTWAVREGLLERSPMVTIARVRSDRREPRVLSPDEVRALIAAEPATRLGFRNRAIFGLLYDTGIRVGELVTARLADLDLTAGVLTVRGKSRRERSVPLSITLRRLLYQYLQRARPDELFASSDRLFLSRAGTPLATTAVNLLLNRAARRAGLTVHVHPHLFRHSFATQFLRNGGDQYSLQAILGHRSTEMVRRYVHLAASDVEARHAVASPLDRMVRGA